MSWSLALGLAVIAVLVLAIVPVRCCRRVVLWLLHRGLLLVVAVAVSGCALFHVFPNLVPANLATVLEQILERLEDHLPALRLLRPLGSPWPLFAVLTVVGARPLLHRLNQARRRADRFDRRARMRLTTASAGERPAPRLLKDLLHEE